MACTLLGSLFLACGNDSGSIDALPADAAGDAPFMVTPGSSTALEIDRVHVDDGRQVAVDFRLRTVGGTALAARDFTINWTLAMSTTDATTGSAGYRSLITHTVRGAFGTTDQPTAESKGTYRDLGGGQSRYTFAIRIPDTADLGATFRIGVWAEELVDGGSPLVANATADFVPNGTSPPRNLASVDTAACNQCHDPLSAHGGVRRETALCATCHTTQLFDPDSEDPGQPGQMNPLDFQALVHRIHMGRDLPTIAAAAAAGVAGVKYHVVGYQNEDNVFAETVANGTVDGGAAARATGVAFPLEPQDCAKCHQQAPGADRWPTVLSRPLCGSCHDATWFAATTPPPLHHAHPGGPLADDQACATCHAPSGGEFDLSVTGAHTVPRKSSQLRGLRAQVVSVAGTPGSNPVVVFQVTEGDGTPVVPLSSLGTLTAAVSGPTSAYRYQNMVRQDMRATAQPNPDGTWTFAFTGRAANDPWYPGGPVIPADAQGTFAVALEARRDVTLAAGVVYEEASDNPVVYFSLDGSPPSPYQSPIAITRCDSCHGEKRNHGNLRRNPEYCVFCHTSDATDWARRPKGPDRNVDVAATADGVEERSIRLSVMVHRIHTGENLVSTVPFAIYGFGGTFDRFDEVRYPGNLADCTSCHLPGRYTLETIPPTALPTVANETATVMHRGTQAHVAGEPTVPVQQSICLGCHDSPTAHAHAALQTTSDGVEACIVCHGEQRQVSVRAAHLAH